MISFNRAHTEMLNSIFSRMASASPNLYLAFVSALREVDRAAADAVVGEDEPDSLLRRQGAARQLRTLLVLASAPVGPQRTEDRTVEVEAPQL